MTTLQLPVSGFDVQLRSPGGVDQVILAEASTPTWDLCLRVLARLAPVQGVDRDGPYGGWELIPLSDADVTMLQLRRMVLGSTIRTDAVCPAAGCGQRIDVDFDVDALMHNRRPRKPRDLEPSEQPGWYRLGALEFRAPRPLDLADLPTGSAGRLALADACIRPIGTRGVQLRRIEAALRQLAPTISGDLAAVCPECGGAIRLYFSVHGFVLAELAVEARSIYSDVHVIAAAYHWSEAEILNLPASRRHAYASMARESARTDG